MSDNYTKEQKAALDTSVHISVQANAGSGKTKILVDRYFDLLVNENVMPHSILAITFTKKAAAEMKSRIIAKIEKALTENIKNKKSKEAKKLRKIREELTKAKISTIHSFCSGILRDYPIEANVLPNFTELDEIEKLQLKDDAVNDVLEDYMDDIKGNTNKLNILDQFEINELIENLKVMLDKPDAMINLDNVYEDKNKYISGKIEFYKELIQDYFDKYYYSLLECYALLEKVPKKTPAQQTKINILGSELQDLENSLTDTNFLELLTNKISHLKSERILTKDGTLNGVSFQGKEFITDAKSIMSQYKDTFGNMFNLYDIYQNDDSDIHFDYIIDFYNLAKKANEKLDALKEIKNGISFDDMIIKANNALKDENIQKQLANKYKFIMVDEFQDTNQIQYELIKNLIGEFNNIEGIKNNLYLVGDAKQSIYRFRNADVRVFMQAIEDIKRLNISNNAAENKTGNVNLTYTFRLFPVVADYINKICEEVFSTEGDKNEYETLYDNLQFGKTDEIFPQMITNNDTKNLGNNFGSVDYLFSYEPNEEEDDSEINSELKPANYEAQKIAEYIKSIVNNNEHKIFDDELQDFRETTYGDITILARKKSNFPELQSAFLNNSIPVIINSGTGFYESQEIMDFSSFIKFLYDNTDDVALAAILKAEFFAVDDNELFKIAKDSNEPTFWDKFCRYSQKEEASELVKRAHKILKNIIPASRRISIEGIIDLITENTGWFAIVKGQLNEMQKIANVKKLRTFAISYQNKGFKSLYDFAAELTLLADNSKEGEANYIKESNAVNVMTVHMSKGLEFPVVILYRLNTKSGGNAKSFEVDKDYGIMFKYKDNKDKRHSIISKFLEDKLKAADEAEEKRVLYVALTRAKYRLCLSMYVKFNDKGKLGAREGLSKLFFNAFPDLQNITYDNIDNFSQNLIMNIKCLNDALSFEGSKYNVQSFVPDDNVLIDLENKNTEESTPYFLLDSIPRSHTKETFSATKLQTFIHEKDEYGSLAFTKRYLLGMSEDDKYFIKDKKEDDEVFGADAGSLIHAVLEVMPEWINDDLDIDNDKLNAAIKEEMKKNKIKNELLFDRIYTDISNVIRSNFIKNKIKNILNSEFEYSLSLAVGDDIINGSIDLLYKDENGCFEIWDWKSNYTGDENTKKDEYDKLKGKYELQMQIYCYFLFRLNSKQNNYKAKLLLTRDAKMSAGNDNWIIKYEWNGYELEQFGENLKKLIQETKENHLYLRYSKVTN